MASGDWDILVWRRADDLRRQAERIQRNFLQMAVAARYRVQQGRNSRWEPPVNVVETQSSLWVMSALPGVTAENVKVELDGNQLVIAGRRPLPDCCHDGELKIWEIPLGQFERRLTVVDAKKTLSVGDVVLRDGLLLIELRKNS
jgi:HSP20 family molecular chaperone IbpA